MEIKELSEKILTKFGKIKRISYIEERKDIYIIHCFLPLVNNRYIPNEKITSILNEICTYIHKETNKLCGIKYTDFYLTEWKD